MSYTYTKKFLNCFIYSIMKHLKHYTLLENKNEFYEEVDQIEGVLSLLIEEKVIR